VLVLLHAAADHLAIEKAHRRRVWLRAPIQDRRRAALRDALPALRTRLNDADIEPAIPRVDRGPRLDMPRTQACLEIFSRQRSILLNTRKPRGYRGLSSARSSIISSIRSEITRLVPWSTLCLRAREARPSLRYRSTQRCAVRRVISASVATETRVRAPSRKTRSCEGGPDGRRGYLFAPEPGFGSSSPVRDSSNC
jgi:hypothetical protein